MSGEEIAEFLEEQRVLICATNGPDGWPHLTPLWYVMRGDEVWSWTYAKSQKVRNLERDPRATLQVEDGERYDELRGVMIRGTTVIHRDVELVGAFGVELFQRYTPDGATEESAQAIRAQAGKRVALQFAAQRIVSWDHRKLGGVY